VILRLAALLHRDRSTSLPSEWSAHADGQQIKLTFGDQWLDSHPLTAADLSQERQSLKSIGIKLKYQ